MKKKFFISAFVISVSISLMFILYFSLWAGKKNVYIAVASTFSGKHKDYGNEMLRGIQLYVDKINATGGVNDSVVKVLVFDDKGTKKGAGEAAKSIVRNKKIRFVLGHYFSNCSLKAAPIYEKNMMPSITSSATLDDLTTNNDWLFRIVPPNSYQTKFITTYAKSASNIKKAVFIYEKDAYGSSLLKTFTEKASELCIDVSFKSLIDTIDSIDSKNLIVDKQVIQIVNKIRNTQDIDLIFLATHANTSANLIVQLRKSKCNQIIIGADSMASKFFIDALTIYTKKYSFSDIYGSGIYSVTWFHKNLSGKANVDFAQAYMNKYHLKPSLISLSAYDSAHVAITALKSIDSNKFSRTVRKNFKQSLERYYDQHHYIKGLTGKIFFNASGDMKKSMIVIQLRDGDYIPAFTQYISVPYEKISDNIIQNGIDESIIANEDEFFAKTNLIFVRVDNIHFNQIHLKKQTFHAKFDIKFRFKGTFHPENIQFINAKHPIVLKNPKKQIQHQDNSQTLIYNVDGIFSLDFNYKKYPFDTQTLSISLRDTKRSIDKILFSAENQKPVSFKLDSDKWSPLHSYSYIEKQEMVSESGKNKIFSKYHVNVLIKTKLTKKTILLFLPLCLSALLVYIGYFFPLKRMNISMIINIVLLIINAYFHLYFDNPFHYIIFSEYLYIFMYGCIGFTVCYQAILITFYLKQLTRTVALLRTMGIILYPIIITGTVFFSYYLVSHI